MPPEDLQQRLQSYGQQHVLAFWDQLSGDQQADLRRQIESIDLELVDSLYRGEVEQPDWAAAARQADPPPAVRLAEREQGRVETVGATADEARELGADAMRQGKLGILVVAGGQGSRLGFEHPKGMFPIGPVSGATLLEIHLKKALGLAKKYGAAVPVYLMTSPVTHDEQVEFLEQHNRFGLAAEDLFVFCQGTMPAVDAATGKLLLAEPGRLFESPDGHGGTVAALAASGAIDHMQQRGIEQLFYFQVDNPLAPACDAELVGYHRHSKSELTSIAVAKQSADDKLGNFVMLDGRLHVIEYSDFPLEVAERRAPDGDLVFWAGSIAIHVFDVEFLARMLSLKDALPFHIARKKVSYLDSTGQKVEPDEPNALKFERFIFDLLPQASGPIVVEYPEAECFAPLKNAPGAAKDTPEYVQQMMVQQHRRWLAAAGANVAEDVAVEIDPVWAVDAEEVARRVKPGLTIDEPTCLRD